MKESNVFKRQQMEKEIEQLVRPYYQPFRGYSKVATKAVVGTFSQLTISHYDINTKSFFIMSPSSTRSICDADRNAREFLSFMPSYSNIQTSKSVLNDEACYVKVLDQTVAMKVESLISEGKLSNKDIYTLVFSHVEPLQGQPNAYYFKPIQEFLFVDDPNTRKPLIVKSLL